MAPSSDVVVVFPALPVTPVMGATQRSMKSWVAEPSGVCRSRAAWSAGRSRGTPWLTKMRSAAAQSSGRFAPSDNFTGKPSICTNCSVRPAAGLASVTVTEAPCAIR